MSCRTMTDTDRPREGWAVGFVRAIAVHVTAWALLVGAFVGTFELGHWWPLALFGVALVGWEGWSIWRLWHRKPRGFRIPPSRT